MLLSGDSYWESSKAVNRLFSFGGVIAQVVSEVSLYWMAWVWVGLNTLVIEALGLRKPKSSNYWSVRKADLVT